MFHFPLSLPRVASFLWHLSVNGSSILSWTHPTSAIVWIDACHRYMAIETQKADVYSECHSYDMPEHYFQVQKSNGLKPIC